MKFSFSAFTFTANATNLDNGEKVTIKVEGDSNGFTFTSIPFPTAQVPVPNGDNIVDLTHLTNSSANETTDFNLSAGAPNGLLDGTNEDEDDATVGDEETGGNAGVNAGVDELGLPTLFDEEVDFIGEGIDRVNLMDRTNNTDASDEYEATVGVSQESFF